MASEAMEYIEELIRKQQAQKAAAAAAARRKADADRRAALEAAAAKAEAEAAAKAAAELADKNKASDGTTIVAPPVQTAPPPLGEVVDTPTYTPTPTPDPTPQNPINNPDIGYDPVSGAPVGTDPTPEQGGDLPPNYVPPPNSKDWLGHVLTPTGSLLPQQLERSGPIRRVTPVSQLFNNPLNSGSGGAPSTAMGNALRGGSNGQV